MHIVLLLPDLHGKSGWSRYGSDLGTALVRRGHTVTAIVAETADVDWCQEIPLIAPNISYLSNPVLAMLHAWKIRRALTKLRPDIVHCIAEPDALPLPFMGNTLPWPTVMTAHSTYAVMPFTMGGVRRTLMQAVCMRLDRIIAISQFTATQMHAADPAFMEHNKIGDKISVIHNAIDMQRIGLHRGNTDSVKRIIGVGAVKSRKGYMQAIEACAVFRDTAGIPFRYDIIGSTDQMDSYVTELKQRIRELKLEDIVTIRGSVSDEELNDAYATADLFLLLSLQEGPHAEGFGLVFLEANAWGIPVIGPDTGGCPEAIDAGKSGYVVNPMHPDIVSGCMEDILKNGSIKPEDCIAWAWKHDSMAFAALMEQEYETARSRHAGRTL